MADADPLSRAVWSSLRGRQSGFAVVNGGARRYDPVYGVFAAVEERTDENLLGLADLIAAGGDVALLEADPPPPIPGTVVVSQDAGVQMIAEGLTDAPSPNVKYEPLAEPDAAEMLALATLTQPGPFFSRTHQLGEFFGVKLHGRIVAMAGERMKPEGFVEVSGVCTHPDHRGRGYAAGLMRRVSKRILARGETPFLHAYASNTGAITLYRSLGFAVRREVVMTRLSASPRDHAR